MGNPGEGHGCLGYFDPGQQWNAFGDGNSEGNIGVFVYVASFPGIQSSANI